MGHLQVRLTLFHSRYPLFPILATIHLKMTAIERTIKMMQKNYILINNAMHLEEAPGRNMKRFALEISRN